ncbi:hypothetical protein EDC94DRAFT_601702 [Helicostylum pulchrum]|nr:hypothetical protein EDC94DRAFT_601702 [Helicostylum pulchrum]
MPSQCPDYLEYSKVFHSPKSGGLLGLPFQRPVEACRKFTSSIIESVISNVTSKISDLDLAQLFANTFPNTLDTTVQSTACLAVADNCVPLSYIITGDINAMWIRDSANQILPYINYIKQDGNLKQLFLGAIYLQAHFFNIDPYANAFTEPNSIEALSESIHSSNLTKRDVPLLDGVFEKKFEIDSFASFMGLSYQYWVASGDDSFVGNSVWVDAVEGILTTIKKQQDPTFNVTSGEPLDTDYLFFQKADRPTETQFLNGRGQPVKHTGMVKSLFRPSDDASVFPFFIPGNAMLSVELNHLSVLLSKSSTKNARVQQLATESDKLSKQIREAIYKYGLIDHPTYGKIFAYEVDGYGSSLIIDDANVPSLLSLSYIGFLDQNDTIYQNTRKLVLSKDNPYYFSGPRGSGIGGPHVIKNACTKTKKSLLTLFLSCRWV